MADMRDRLAEIIRNAHMMANPLSQVGYAEADALLANGVILPEWISVKDRLPENGTKCLVYTNRGEYGGCEITYYNDGFYIQYSDVTHWQYLPQPPKEEKALREKDE